MQQKISAFDNLAIEYDRWYDENHNIFVAELMAIKKLYHNSYFSIEIGAGTGRFADALNISFALEPASVPARIARNRHINVTIGRAENMPFMRRTFDNALLITTLCFLDNPNLAFKEIYRILKYKGQLLIGMIDKESSLGQKYNKKKKNNPFYKYASFYSVSETINLLNDNGFNPKFIIQTLFPSSDSKVESILEGYGKGGFVVISAEKEIIQ